MSKSGQSTQAMSSIGPITPPDEIQEIIESVEAWLEGLSSISLKEPSRLDNRMESPEANIQRLFGDILENLMQVIHRNASGEKRQALLIESELVFIDSFLRVILQLSKLASIDPSIWSQIQTKSHWLIQKCESARRRLRLQYPIDAEEFETNIRWMAERGDLEDLDLLRQVRANPPFNSEAIQNLLETAEERIHDRVYDPQTVVDREEAAYQEHRQEWDEAYAGEFIAIHRGQVIDHDTDEDRLIERLDERQRNEGRFRAYIVEIGAPVYVARGPTVLRSQKIEMTEERS